MTTPGMRAGNANYDKTERGTGMQDNDKEPPIKVTEHAAEVSGISLMWKRQSGTGRK